MSDKSGPLRLTDLPVMNFGNYMLDKMKDYREQVAVIDASSRKTYTYNDVISRSERLAAGLQRLGVRPGDVVCIFSPNHIDFLTVTYATALINAVLQCINPLFTKDDFHKVLKDCNTRFVITVPDLASNAKEVRKSLPNIEIIVFGECDGCISFESVLASSGTSYTTPHADWKKTTVCLLYSSGTTGFPKAVKHTHFSIITNIVIFDRSGIFSPGQSLISFLPFFHGYGLLINTTAHGVGSKVVVVSKFEIDSYLELIKMYKPVTLQVVPPVMVLFAKYPKVSAYDLSSVKRIMCAAAPLSEEIESAVMKRLNLGDIQQGYGMTEVGITHLNTVKESRRYSVGKLSPLTEIKIVDVETGKPLGINVAGEVWVRGPQQSDGYLNLPAQTREMFLKDGWVRTGDIGKQDADGYLYIIDRLKELIKYKANQVAPATLEDILLRHEAVADVGVIGIPDEEAGELPKAYVVKKPEKQISERELQDFVASLVAPYMKLRGGVEFIDEIPRSLSGKILRRTLRERAKTTQSKL